MCSAHWLDLNLWKLLVDSRQNCAHAYNLNWPSRPRLRSSGLEVVTDTVCQMTCTCHGSFWLRLSSSTFFFWLSLSFIGADIPTRPQNSMSGIDCCFFNMWQFLRYENIFEIGIFRIHHALGWKAKIWPIYTDHNHSCSTWRCPHDCLRILTAVC